MRISGTRERVLPNSALKGVGRQDLSAPLAGTDAALLDAVANALLCDDTAEPNLVVLSGEVGEPPLPIQGRTAQHALHLTVDHRTPEDPASGRLASTSVEVPNALLASYPGKVAMGDAVLVLGKAAGEGEVLATAVAPARPRTA
jgi:hypothetical protein